MSEGQYRRSPPGAELALWWSASLLFVLTDQWSSNPIPLRGDTWGPGGVGPSAVAMIKTTDVLLKPTLFARIYSIAIPFSHT